MESRVSIFPCKCLFQLAYRQRQPRVECNMQSRYPNASRRVHLDMPVSDVSVYLRVYVRTCVVCMCVRVYLALVPLHILSPPPPIALQHPSFLLVRGPRANGCREPPLFPRQPPAATVARERAEFPPGAHAERRATEKCAGYIKGKIFLCPVIGGCRGNTRATSTSNYFQTLRIERAPPPSRQNSSTYTHTHTHAHIFPYLPVALLLPYHPPIYSPPTFLSSPPSTGNHLRSPPLLVALPSPSRVLIVDGWGMRRLSEGVRAWICAREGKRKRERERERGEVKRERKTEEELITRKDPPIHIGGLSNSSTEVMIQKLLAAMRSFW